MVYVSVIHESDCDSCPVRYEATEELCAHCQAVGNLELGYPCVQGYVSDLATATAIANLVSDDAKRTRGLDGYQVEVHGDGC